MTLLSDLLQCFLGTASQNNSTATAANPTPGPSASSNFCDLREEARRQRRKARRSQIQQHLRKEHRQPYPRAPPPTPRNDPFVDTVYRFTRDLSGGVKELPVEDASVLRRLQKKSLTAAFEHQMGYYRNAAKEDVRNRIPDVGKNWLKEGLQKARELEEEEQWRRLRMKKLQREWDEKAYRSQRERRNKRDVEKEKKKAEGRERRKAEREERKKRREEDKKRKDQEEKRETRKEEKVTAEPIESSEAQSTANQPVYPETDEQYLAFTQHFHQIFHSLSSSPTPFYHKFSIPWPVLTKDRTTITDLSQVTGQHIHHFLEFKAQFHKLSMRAVIRQELKLWHPDKFVPFIQAKVVEEDREVVKEFVTVLTGFLLSVV